MINTWKYFLAIMLINFVVVNISHAVSIEVQIANPSTTVFSNQAVSLDLLFAVTPDSNAPFDPDLVMAERGTGGFIFLYDKNGIQQPINLCGPFILGGPFAHCFSSSGLQASVLTSTSPISYPDSIILPGETVQYTYHTLSLNVENLSDGDYFQVGNGLDFDYAGDSVIPSYPNGSIWRVTYSEVPVPSAAYLFVTGIMVLLTKRRSAKSHYLATQ